MITDSGGVQEEAPALGKPVLVTRETTERTEGLDAGTLRLVGSDPERIFAEAARLLDDPVAYRQMADAHNPYGDGQAGRRVVVALEHLLRGGVPPTPFGPGYDRSAIALAAGFEVDGTSLLQQLEADLAERAPLMPLPHPQPTSEEHEGIAEEIAEEIAGQIVQARGAYAPEP